MCGGREGGLLFSTSQRSNSRNGSSTVAGAQFAALWPECATCTPSPGCQPAHPPTGPLRSAAHVTHTHTHTKPYRPSDDQWPLRGSGSSMTRGGLRAHPYTP